jgi:hypothetical protein
MALETSMRARVTKALRPLDAIAVENAALPGTPDVEFIGGWIELKTEDKWPARPTTPLRLKRFEIEQRVWLRRRVRRGGHAFVLLRVGREWMLFRGDVAAAKLGHSTREELGAVAMYHWKTTPSYADLLQTFRRETGQ